MIDMSSPRVPGVFVCDTASEFLSTGEKELIQTNYELILDHMKVEELVLSLYSAKLISQREKSDLDEKPTGKRRQYIIDEVFLKATYSQIKDIRRILTNSTTKSHAELAKLLPVREVETKGDTVINHYSQEPTVIRPGQPVQASSHNNPFISNLEDRRSSDPCSLKAPVQEGKYYSDINNDSDSSDQEMQPRSLYKGAAGGGNSASSSNLVMKGFNKIRNSFRKTKGGKSWGSSPDMRSSTAPALGCYGVKDDNNPVYGKSVCFIIANFTDDLTGYQQDAADIADFHRNILHCDKVFKGKMGKLSMRDLTKEEFMNVLQAIQDYLKNEIAGGEIDRFFLYILSHGDEDGIMMCEAGSRTEEQGCDQHGKPIRVQMQDIVNMFSHDQVPLLKTFPKVFINQCCQGTEILRAAGPSSLDSPDSAIRMKQPWKPPQFKLAVGADVIICDATSNRSMSWVSEGGSLFIQTLLKVMTDYLYDEHFYDILVEVNNQISHKVKKGLNPSDNRIVPASQMPKIHSQLTKKFFLARPQQKTKFY